MQTRLGYRGRPCVFIEQYSRGNANDWLWKLVSFFLFFARKLGIHHPQMKGFHAVSLASVTVSTVTLKSPSLRIEKREMRTEQSKTMLLCSHTVGTMAALWLLTGGPLKFTNILYKAAKWLCTDSSSPAHRSACTCVLACRPRLPSAERKTAFNV